MGKMRLKLSHVMPHAWFFKLKEVGKPGRSLTYKALEPVTSAYASPINLKAIDIPFPATADTQQLQKSPPPACAEDFSSSDQLHLIQLSADDECRPSIILPHTSAHRLDQQHIIPASTDADHPPALSSAPAYAIADHAVSCRANFDVRELERRLKALGSEDRRKYYTSPMLLSVAAPTPMIDEGMHLGIGRDDVGAEEPFLDMGASVFPLSVSGPNNRGRSPLMGRPGAYADGERRLCRSIDESNRHSTSSSDTGFERGSSSVWERDVFSITSDGSEAFTTAYADDVESMHKSRQRYRQLRERMSPSLYAAGHMDSGLSRFYVDHRHGQEEAGLLAGNDTMSRFYKDGLVVEDAEDEIVHLCERDMSVLNVTDDESGRGLYAPDNVAYCDHPSRNNGGVYCNHEGSRLQSPSNSRAGSVWRAMELAPDYEEMSDSISVQCDRDDLPSAPYDSGANRLSARRRKLSGYGDSPYVRCKERLLSRRPDSDRPTNSIAIGEAEQESPPIYTTFKFKQRTRAQSKGRQSMYLDPGLYNGVSLGQRLYGYDTIDSTDMDSMASWSTELPSTMDPHTHLHRPRTSAHHIKPPQLRAEAFPPAPQLRRKASWPDQGPSWPKGMPRAAAVRETTSDPSFEQFSPPTSGGGEAGGDCSRVFDSFAMVKCSYEPKHDFKESMLEMIMEKDLRTSHDMVELLQCYLTLNADAYHDTIVKVFTEVWSEMFRHV